MSQKLLGMLYNLPKDYGKCMFATLEMKLDYFGQAMRSNVTV